MNKIPSILFAAVALGASVSSCSVFESITGKKSESSSTVRGSQATEVGTETSEKSSREKLAEDIAKSDDAATPRVMPPVVVTPQPAVSPEPAVPAKTFEHSGIAKEIAGEWTIVQVGSTVIDRDENMPYVVFVPSEGRIYANNGCNTLNGDYSIEGDEVTFHHVACTMRLCPDVTFDHEINTVIADDTPVRVKITEVGTESILEFVTSTGKTLMRLRRGNLEFLNGQWEIVEVSGLGKPVDTATVFFDITDLKMHGNTGCNFINGEIYLDHRMANAVDFSNIITTMRMCPHPEQQTAILVALEETESAISDGTDRVLLLGPDGKIEMELKRMPL